MLVLQLLTVIFLGSVHMTSSVDTVHDPAEVLKVLTSTFQTFGEDVQQRLKNVSISLMSFEESLFRQNQVNSEVLRGLAQDVKDLKELFAKMENSEDNPLKTDSTDIVKFLGKLTQDFTELKKELFNINEEHNEIIRSKLDSIGVFSETLSDNLKNNNEIFEQFREVLDSVSNSLIATNRNNEIVIENNKEEIGNLRVNISVFVEEKFEEFSILTEKLQNLKVNVSEATENSQNLKKSFYRKVDSLGDLVKTNIENQSKSLSETVSKFENMDSNIRTFNVENNLAMKENSEALVISSNVITENFKNNSLYFGNINSDLNDMKEVVENFKIINSTLIQFQNNVINAIGKIETSLILTTPRHRDCADVMKDGHRQNGVYRLRPFGGEREFDVYCDMKTEGGGWTVFQRRGDFGLPVDFFSKMWEDYKSGFGELNKEFWLGNDHISAISLHGGYELRVQLWDVENFIAFAKYDNFRLDNEEQLYRLHVDGYSGTAGDALSYHNGRQFSTKDVGNDGSKHCAQMNLGGWWLGGSRCQDTNLNGLNLQGHNERESQGIVWRNWKGSKYSLSYTEMKIRPKAF